MSDEPAYNGPWHFVQATLDAKQIWDVNGVPSAVDNGSVLAFILTDDALHYVGSDRAVDLGVWDTVDQFIAHASRMSKAKKKAA